ncbi:hypothetical protein [Paenibacillus sp. LjRoot153]|uniref:hypothetical protein n=1 Tax=Paenibacillus sp. LjRoot153 TaxID=3342270 RepID=UPI003F507152
MVVEENAHTQSLRFTQSHLEHRPPTLAKVWRIVGNASVLRTRRRNIDDADIAQASAAKFL